MIIIGAVAGFYLLNHKTTPSPVTSTSTTSTATSTTTTSIAPQNNNVIMLYEYNSTYYVFMIPYTNDSGPALPNITWWDVLHSQVVYYGGTYIRAEPVTIVINIKPDVYEGFNIDLTSYGVPIYKLVNGYAMVFAQPGGNYTFVKGEVYNATLVLIGGGAFFINIEYGGLI
uniref:Uncharacterized protein n=1 Tax=Saccharolobus islandicus TaxID=43080 RepID=Q0ZNV4_SACIS|nr:hypothetical protein [Sulfolobus islandicus]ABE99612.1 hypothetical protein [Sulfolobus islandicus]